MKWSKPNSRKIDIEMKDIVHRLTLTYEVDILACCCGHGKYHPTIVYRSIGGSYILEMFSGLYINRKRRFYIKDRKGFYYIPEVESYWRYKKHGIPKNKRIL